MGQVGGYQTFNSEPPRARVYGLAATFESSQRGIQQMLHPTSECQQSACWVGGGIIFTASVICLIVCFFPGSCAEGKPQMGSMESTACKCNQAVSIFGVIGFIASIACCYTMACSKNNEREITTHYDGP